MTFPTFSPGFKKGLQKVEGVVVKDFLCQSSPAFSATRSISGLRQQAVISTNHRSATVSPSSENSPSNDLQSEEGSYPDQQQHLNYQQYSSQDSLPDSPYSSQSLDSQPAQGPGKKEINKALKEDS